MIGRVIDARVNGAGGANCVIVTGRLPGLRTARPRGALMVPTARSPGVGPAGATASGRF